MRIQKVESSSQRLFGHTSSDHYIRMGRMLSIEEVKKKFFRFEDPWYKKLLYPLEDLRDYIVKHFKKR